MLKETENKKINQKSLLPLDLPSKKDFKKEKVEDGKPPFETTTLWDIQGRVMGKNQKEITDFRE